MGQLAAFCPLGTHLSRGGQGSVEELGGAGAGREDEHALFLGLVVVSQHAPESKRGLQSARAGPAGPVCAAPSERESCDGGSLANRFRVPLLTQAQSQGLHA